MAHEVMVYGTDEFGKGIHRSPLFSHSSSILQYPPSRCAKPSLLIISIPYPYCYGPRLPFTTHSWTSKRWTDNIALSYRTVHKLMGGVHFLQYVGGTVVAVHNAPPAAAIAVPLSLTGAITPSRWRALHHRRAMAG